MSKPLDFAKETWNKMESMYEGVQVMDSIIMGRPVRYYVFRSKDGIPIITLHEHEWDITKDKKLHKKVVGEIINKLTEGL